MSRKQKLGGAAVLALVFIGFLVWRITQGTVAVFQPRGTIGAQEKHLIIIAVLLCMIVVIPVYFMLFFFAFRYREGNKKARYQPELDGSRLFETIWWGVPLAIILVLSVITFRSSHQLDPFKPVSAQVPPLKIQVVALQWRWLFIYPDQNIASINFIEMPVNTPISFEITSDAPMNSFWIPQLGGQIYAMSGMATNLNLQASKVGDYQGVSANISGKGFSGMHFTARAATEADYINWLAKMKNNRDSLTTSTYNKISQPNLDTSTYFYGGIQSGLFDSVLAKYGIPAYFSPGSHQ